MAEQKTASVFDSSDLTDEQLRQRLRMQEEFSIRAEERAQIIKNTERIQKENRQKREDAKPQTAVIKPDAKVLKQFRKDRLNGMGRFVPGKTPEYVDTHNHDLFGEGTVRKAPEPWMPRDTKRMGKDGPELYERGQGPKLTFSDTQLGGSGRFVAAYETKEFKDNWIREEMGKRGFAMDGGPQVGTAYVKALNQVQSAWRSQHSEWQKRKGDFLLGELRDQRTGASAPAPAQPAPGLEAQGAATVAAGDAAGASAAAQPLVRPGENPAKPSTVIGTVQLPGEQPTEIAVDGQHDTAQAPAKAPTSRYTIKSDDGRIRVTGDMTEQRARQIESTVTSMEQPSVGSRVGRTGRYLGNGAVYFGNDDGYEKARRNAGVFA